eukprot:705665-Hanusia_phi.AAC.1
MATATKVVTLGLRFPISDANFTYDKILLSRKALALASGLDVTYILVTAITPYSRRSASVDVEYSIASMSSDTTKLISMLDTGRINTAMAVYGLPLVQVLSPASVGGLVPSPPSSNSFQLVVMGCLVAAGVMVGGLL